MKENVEAGRDETYGWARRHSLFEPYDFSIYYDHLWDDKAELAKAARRWQQEHLLERKRALEEQMAELQRRMEILDADLERNEVEEFTS